MVKFYLHTILITIRIISVCGTCFIKPTYNWIDIKLLKKKSRITTYN